ncbi:carboxypeptidase regulatory-like domain-containing protein [Bosea sp. PAMC 26642]|uniref:carboxypeptidase regulatory-like domain-containing protein n=1 Tax=Bosea sp. (strain PAMC 26642) TaxID=1792307 RepID=UPI000A6A8588|nr:carboxypeptidase regulatory-like domain-containing protein [Bosea sp. PAMC 26642]
MRLLLGLGVLLVLAACVDRKPGKESFSAEEAAFIKKPGTGVIVGHAFRTKPSGVVVNAAGEIVRLIPSTAFSRERFTLLFGKSKFLPHAGYPRDDNPDPGYAEYARNTKAEANGRFAFENVPPGDYIVSTQVIWGDEEELFRLGGMVYDTVTLTGKEKEPVSVVLSGN